VFNKAAFLDRDGTINIDGGYISTWDRFHFLPGAIDALAKLRDDGYALIVVTNQSGIGRGFFTERDFFDITSRLSDELLRIGISILATYNCPHMPSEYCKCRKPQPGLLLQAARDHAIDLSQSIMVGDKMTDVEAGIAAGVGNSYLISPETYPSLKALVDSLVSDRPGKRQDDRQFNHKK